LALPPPPLTAPTPSRIRPAPEPLIVTEVAALAGCPGRTAMPAATISNATNHPNLIRRIAVTSSFWQSMTLKYVTDNVV
jgi:hypothetical protein